MSVSKKVILCHKGSAMCQTAASVLRRIGYEVEEFGELCEEHISQSQSPPDIIIVDQSYGEIESFFKFASPATKVVTLEYDRNDSGLLGFIDLTEHLLRGFNAKLPELIMLVNDLLHPKPSGIRRKPRVPGGFSCRIRVDGREMEGHVFNLSEDGAFVEMEDPPPRNTEINLSIDFTQQPMELSGKVVWRVLPEESSHFRSPPGAGVNFRNLDSRAHDMLTRVVHNKGRVNNDT